VDQIDAIVSRACQRIIDRINVGNGQREQDDHQQPDCVPDASAELPSLFLTTKGKMTRTPSNFILSRGNVKSAWLRFCCWDRSNKIPPLRAVFGSELERKFSSRFTRYRKLMEAIMNEAKDIGVWIEPENAIEAREILNKVDLNKIIPFTTRTHRTRRLDQLSWSTLAKYFCFSRKVLQDHQPDDGHDGDGDTDDESLDGDDDTDDDGQDGDDDGGDGDTDDGGQDGDDDDDV